MAKDEERLQKDDDPGEENPPAEGDASSNDPKGDDGSGAGAEDDVKDKHGQPGINKERHDKEVAALKAEIAELKAQAADAAESKAKRDEYEKKVAELEGKMSDNEVSHKLELAGCKSIKAAKALLDDCDGDVSKLKESHPYLFDNGKPKGSTGGKPEGPASALSGKIDAAMGVKD